MQKTVLVFLISSILITGWAYSEDAAQNEYTVQKHDTLWDISGAKLQDPLMWPKLWSANPHIANPHRIYPGDKVIIPPSVAASATPEAPGEQAATAPSAEPEKVSKSIIRPRKKEVAQPAVTSESPLVRKAYIISRDHLLSSGWIDGELSSAGKILATPGEHEMMGKGDMVYLALDKGEPSQKYFSVRDLGPVSHPITGKPMGNFIRITGILNMKGMENGNPKAEIVTSYEEILAGDTLITYNEMEPPVTPDTLRTPAVTGYIVHSNRGTIASVKGDIVFLDKGTNEGLQVGDIFTVFAKTPVERPIGKVQIVALRPATASAVITENSEEIITGASWGQEK